MGISCASVVVKPLEMGAARAVATIKAAVVAVVSHRKAGMVGFWLCGVGRGRGGHKWVKGRRFDIVIGKEGRAWLACGLDVIKQRHCCLSRPRQDKGGGSAGRAAVVAPKQARQGKAQRSSRGPRPCLLLASLLAACWLCDLVETTAWI
jgi:hypothetical protein